MPQGLQAPRCERGFSSDCSSPPVAGARRHDARLTRLETLAGSDSFELQHPASTFDLRLNLLAERFMTLSEGTRRGAQQCQVVRLAQVIRQSARNSSSLRGQAGLQRLKYLQCMRQVLNLLAPLGHCKSIGAGLRRARAAPSATVDTFEPASQKLPAELPQPPARRPQLQLAQRGASGAQQR